MSNEADVNMKDHDLLVQIARDMSWMKDTFIQHAESNADEFGNINRKVDAAHRRIDWLTVSGVLSIIILAVTMWFKK